VIPLRDENPTRGTPVVVIALIIINTLVFLIDQLGGGHRGALAGLAMVPQNIINAFQGQPPVPDYIYPSLHPVWLTIFTSMFMHANLLHIGGNMLCLWIFGNNIEDAVGHFKFIMFYLVGGLAAALAHILSALASSNPQAALIPTIGASGAIAAVLGAYLVLFPTARVICLIPLGCFMTTAAVPAVIVLLLWILSQIVSVGAIGGRGVAGGGIAYWAHIGGFVAGMVLILLMGGKRILRRPPPEQYYSRFRE
jgi:membrane associated rhomboid family serine protease